MTRIALFGAGQASVNYLKSVHGAQGKIVAIFDNDPAKHGILHCGFPVVSPDQWKELNLDHIILTTQWALDVYNDLVRVHGIPPELMSIPPKSLFKTRQPFYDDNIRKQAEALIIDLVYATQQERIEVWCDFGTLLGTVRSGAIIPWDDDIDFSIMHSSLPFLESCLIDFLSENDVHQSSAVYRLQTSEGEICGLTIHLHDSTGKILFPITFAGRSLGQDGDLLHLPSHGMWSASSSHFSGCEPHLLAGNPIPCPVNSSIYLEHLYGPNWRVPKTDFRLTDYHNLRSVSPQVSIQSPCSLVPVWERHNS